VCNIAGGVRSTVNSVIDLLRGLTGSHSPVVYQPPQSGDPPHTAADTTRARQLLDYQPAVSKEEGIAREVQWLEKTLSLQARR
jgi:nucleoside-diphosphate-sugar epimerase